jgi:PNKP adenylyltransferase domain, C-terminal region
LWEELTERGGDGMVVAAGLRRPPLERLVRGEPLRRAHECVFGVLALESEPVDPRL